MRIPLHMSSRLDGIARTQAGETITVGDGLHVASSIAYLYKQLGLKAWVNYVDKFNIYSCTACHLPVLARVDAVHLGGTPQNIQADGRDGSRTPAAGL